MIEKSIVFFTIGYPYGIGDEFLETEMKYAESYFDRILIVSCNKRTSKASQYIPHNAELISIKDNVSVMEMVCISLFGLFSFNTWHQIFLGLKQKGFANAVNCIKSILLEQNQICLLKRNEKNWIGKYSFFYSYWLSGAASYLALRKKSINGLLFSRAHGYDCFSYRGFHPFRKEQLKCLNYVFPISNAGKEDLIEQGCDPHKIIVSRLGVEKTSFIMNPYILSDIKTIVTCSNIVSLKRLDLLIDALSNVDDKIINWVHFGDGDIEDEVRSRADQKLSKKTNIQYSFKGRVSPEEIFRFYGSISVDCFVNCSDVEGIPVSIMEAMSYGIPCIARDVGGNREIVSNDNGLLLPKNVIAEDIKNAIESIITMSQTDYMLKRKNAFETYMQQYNASYNYPFLYQKILEM